MLVPPPISRREQEEVPFLSAATPALGAAERTSWGRGSRRFNPGRFGETGRPGLDACRSGFEASNASLYPRGREHPFFGYKRAQGGFEGAWMVRASR
jgi:hypothetical protein